MHPSWNCSGTSLHTSGTRLEGGRWLTLTTSTSFIRTLTVMGRSIIARGTKHCPTSWLWAAVPISTPTRTMMICLSHTRYVPHLGWDTISPEGLMAVRCTRTRVQIARRSCWCWWSRANGCLSRWWTGRHCPLSICCWLRLIRVSQT